MDDVYMRVCKLMSGWRIFNVLLRMVYILVMAKKKNVARMMRESRSARDIAGRTPTRTAPAYRDSASLGPGFDEPSYEQGSGYGLTQEEQNQKIYPDIARRMFNAQSFAEREIPFVGRSPMDFAEQYVPSVKKRSQAARILDAFGSMY